jgi:hypothetical protein
MAAAAIDIYGRAARLFFVLQDAAASDATAAELAAQASTRRLADHRRHWPPAQYATWLSDQLDHAANKVTEPM